MAAVSTDPDDEHVVVFLEAMVEINKGRTWSRKNRVERRWSIACPKCSGTIQLLQAASNGHVQGACGTAACFAFIE